MTWTKRGYRCLTSRSLRASSTTLRNPLKAKTSLHVASCQPLKRSDKGMPHLMTDQKIIHELGHILPVWQDNFAFFQIEIRSLDVCMFHRNVFSFFANLARLDLESMFIDYLSSQYIHIMTALKQMSKGFLLKKKIPFVNQGLTNFIAILLRKFHSGGSVQQNFKLFGSISAVGQVLFTLS